MPLQFSVNASVDGRKTGNDQEKIHAQEAASRQRKLETVTSGGRGAKGGREGNENANQIVSHGNEKSTSNAGESESEVQRVTTEEVMEAETKAISSADADAELVDKEAVANLSSLETTSRRNCKNERKDEQANDGANVRAQER